MGSMSIFHWLISPLALAWFLAAVSVLGPFHGPAVLAALTLPQWLH